MNYLTQIQCTLSANYQCHSMITYGDYIYIVGGYNNKKCDVYNVKTESVNEDFILPDLGFDRVDPGTIIINHKYLIVFAGYSISEKDHLSTFERMILFDPLDYFSIYNIKKCKQWELLPIYTDNLVPYKMSNMVIINIDEEKVLLVGGMGIGVVKNVCFNYNFKDYKISNSLFKLPSEIAFSEKNMVSDDGQVFIGFNYGACKLLRINIYSLQVAEIELN